MKIGFHPVFDNPIRMGYVTGWRGITDLVERVDDLAHAVGERTVVPARWEPFHRECPSFRYAAAYAWARSQLQDPAAFAQGLALFPGEAEQTTTRIGRANLQILRTRSEPSHITRRFMLIEALGVWESEAGEWLEQIAEACAALGVVTSAPRLHEQVRQALQPLAKDVLPEDDGYVLPDFQTSPPRSHGYDPELLHMDGWTPDPGVVILPVDDLAHSLRRQILRLDLHKVVLLRAGKTVRTVPWEAINLVHLADGAVSFEINGGPSLSVAGYKHPEQVLATVATCYKAATERILQSLAARVTRITP